MKVIITKGSVADLIKVVYEDGQDPDWAIQFDVGFAIIAKDKDSAEKLHQAIEKYGQEAWSDRSI